MKLARSTTLRPEKRWSDAITPFLIGPGSWGAASRGRLWYLPSCRQSTRRLRRETLRATDPPPHSFPALCSPPRWTTFDPPERLNGSIAEELRPAHVAVLWQRLR